MVENNVNLNDIDFLPASYREQGVKRRTGLWRLLVVTLFGAAFASASAYQREIYQQAEADLIAVDAQNMAAMAQNKRLADTQTRLAAASARAELLTYMRHPWPRSQILAAVLRDLPASIRLSSLTLLREQSQKRVVREQPAANPSAAVESADRATRDLTKLRGELDAWQTIVTLQGFADDTGELHDYLARLGNSPLLLKAELGSIGSPSTDQNNAVRFSARLVVRPGYGQPGGPEPPALERVAQRETAVAAQGGTGP